MRRRKSFLAVAWLLIAVLIVSACGGGGGNGGGSANSGNASESGDDKKPDVTLRVFMSNVFPLVQDLAEKFTEENPGIKIEFDTTPVDQYDSLLNTKLASGDAPDIFQVYSGKKMERLVKGGHLMDLSDQPWVERLVSGAKERSSHDGKVYALPTSQFVIGVIYNKKIFADLGLSVPEHWEAFLETAQKIKDAGITPLGLGLKDLFTGQFIPYAMAPSAVYRVQPDFDRLMEEGKATFSDSPWKQMMEDYIDLEKRGFFNTGVLGTSNDQIQQLMASGEVAMMVTLSPMLAAIRALNPDNEYGMFPLPYVQEGEKPWVSANVATVAGISSKTKYPEEAKKFLEFLAQPENMKILMENNLSVYTDIASEADPAVAEIEPYLVNGTYPFLDSVWPTTVQPVLFTGVQGLFGGRSIDEMLAEMDKAYQMGLNESQ